MQATNGLLATLLLVVVGVAGCVGTSEGKTQATVTGSEGPTPEFDETTGAIEGVVHDDSLNPLANAQIGIQEDPAKIATTDIQGHFAVSHLAPGTYHVFAQKLGYESAARATDVSAGALAHVDVTLAPLPSLAPRESTRIERGLFGCGASWRPGVVYSGISVCGAYSLLLNRTDFDKFLITWQLRGNVSEWKGDVFEMQWQTNQALGKGLAVIWEVQDCPNVRNSTFARASGHSPLRVRLNETQLSAALGNNTDHSDCDAKKNCDDKKCKIMSRVFSDPDTLGASSPADVGITIQQPFTQYDTEFFNEEPPPTFSAIKDT